MSRVGILASFKLTRHVGHYKLMESKDIKRTMMVQREGMGNIYAQSLKVCFSKKKKLVPTSNNLRRDF